MKKELLEEMDDLTLGQRSTNKERYHSVSNKIKIWQERFDHLLYNLGLLIGRGYDLKQIAGYYDIAPRTLRSLFKRGGLQRMKKMFVYAFENNQRYIKQVGKLDARNYKPTAWHQTKKALESKDLLGTYQANIFQARVYDVIGAASMLSNYYDDVSKAWSFYYRLSDLSSQSYAEIFLNVNNWPDRERVVKQTLEYQLSQFKRVYEMLKEGYDAEAVAQYCEDVLSGDDEFLLSFD